MRYAICLLLFFSLCLSFGCEKSKPTPTEASRNEGLEGEKISLPQPKTKGGFSLEEILNRRESRRAFQRRPLTLEEVGQLLWAAGGRKVDAVSGATRTAPSAGGIYPLNLFLVCGEVEGLSAGVYRYEPSTHVLEEVSSGDKREELAQAALGQRFVAEAPASLLILVDYDRAAARYGERALRYSHMDAGCVSQNAALQAESLGLGTVVVGAFDDMAVENIVGEGGTPLAILPVGRP